VTSYSVAPALPTGLGLSTTTGAISGTPTAAAALANYTVTASNSAGSTTAILSITVNPPATAPSALTYPQTTITATVSQQITADIPTVTGTTPTFAVAPTLPAGLSINPSTGAIFGTPTAPAALASYTVTASNSTGSTTAILSITVNPPTAAPSNLAYPQATISTAAGLSISTDIPSVTGTVFSFTVAPTLPAGLTLDNVTGAISGTPIAAAAEATYTVTAANSLGSTTASVVITVGKAVTTLLDLGHGTSVSFMRSTSNRLLSLDGYGHWVLWDYATSAELASGDQVGVSEYPVAGSPTYPLGVDIAGSTVAIALPNGLELRSSADGHLFTTIASPFLNPPVASGYWWKLATDGTYVCGGTKAGMAVWDISGQLLASRQGDYSAAKVFAAPGQVQIALGPAGANVIETVSTSSGTSTTGPAFSGNFNSWFFDGQRFLTKLGTTVWTYSEDSVQQGIVSLPSFQNLAGNGDWFYTYPNIQSTDPLIIYPVGGSVASATISLSTSPYVTAAPNSLGIFDPVAGAVTVVDLSGATPVKAVYPATLYWPLAFTANSATQWTVGGADGLILDGASLSTTARNFGYGRARSIAANSSYIALALGNGTIPYFSTSSLTSVNTINSSSSSLAMSSTGSVLAALSGATLNIYSLPSGSVSNSWPSQVSAGTSQLSTFTMSADRSTLGLIFLDSNSGKKIREVVPTAGGAAIWSDSPYSSYGFIQLSPDGSMFAVSDGYSVTLFTGGQVTGSVPGEILGWIDSSHFLTSVFNSQGAYTLYSGNAIYDKTGALTSKVNMPLIPLNSVVGGGSYPGPVYAPPTSVLPVSSSSIYYPPQNKTYSLTTGSPLYTSPLTPTGVGAIAGSQVVFATNNRVVVDTY
jgi:hypothetical protein